ncbi:MAG TPA: hypothetical protein VNO70_15910 [Blastocatellia bacterium]|nr:hypothetical protein [Blastocatellia bacterium]
MISIRPGYIPYLIAIAVLATVGAALLNNGATAAAFAVWGSIAPITLFALLDRIEFDGEKIRRRGPLAFLLTHLARVPQALAVADIETVSTEVTSLSFASGDARLLYRTRISGAGVEITIRSRHRAYVPFIKALFHAVGPHKLDPRSFELFEYFESNDSLKRAPVLRSEIAVMPAPLLRRLANALRLAGRLAQASSYFRIAYEKEPRNPELLYEMSRFFHATAQNEDARLLQRSNACLRLASRLADARPDLLERIGEVFFERLDYKHAQECFRRALALDPARFRANMGLAEIALRDGKLAHVAHYYNAAAAASDAALARMARREARYYERLMGDDHFLGAELRRIRLSVLLHWARRLAAMTFLGAWLAAGIAGRFAGVVEDFGLALMAMTGIVWCAATLALRFFGKRNL